MNEHVLPPARPPDAEQARAQRQQALFASLAATPYAHDFFHTLRLLEGLNPRAPRLGRALRPRDEPVRLGQDPELDFAPAALSSFQTRDNAKPRLGQRFFGLFGPMGPMPLHLTEYARERQHNHADPTLARFADVFHHRALLLFYRAWAQAQPASHLDRPGDDAFSRWVSALFGAGPKEFAGRDSLADDAKRLHAGTLARAAKSAEGLRKIVSQYFRVPVRLEPHVGHWMPLRTEDRTQLLPGSAGSRRAALGRNAVAGSKVWDRQYRFALHLGPLSWPEYQRFLPGQPSLIELRDWVRQYVGLSLACDVRPCLRGAEVPALAMRRRAQTQGLHGRLGWTTWLGTRRPPSDRHDRSDLRIRPETPTHKT